MTEFTTLLDEFLAYWWRIHPTRATAAGVHAHDGQLGRYDEGTRVDQAQRLREYRRSLERVPVHGEAEAVERDIVVGQTRWKIHELEEVRPYARNPLIYVGPVLSALYVMAVRDYAPAEDRARRARDRLLDWPRVLAEARENLTDPAPVLVEATVATTRAGLTLLETALPMSLGAALEDDTDEFAAWQNALRGAESALLDFATWLEDEVLPHADGEFAIGRNAFEAALRDLHGITESALELKQYGKTLQRETAAELVALASEIDGDRDWRELVESLKDDHPVADELVEAYATEVDRARAFVEEHELVGFAAGEELEVTVTPDFLRPLIPYAAYLSPAPLAVEQKGFFFVTVPEPGSSALRDHSRYGVPVTALHEAYPGHHLQLTRSNQVPGVARRVFKTPVFAEGWALYCEELMWEEGFYTDSRVRLLQLNDLYWRACRVVVDVGLHTEGWTPEEAVDYLVEEAGLERTNAEIEARRYCAEPTQPLSYAVGRREILRLRERYRERAGSEFSLREFHDELLSWGTVPPTLVARAMGLESP